MTINVALLYTIGKLNDTTTKSNFNEVSGKLSAVYGQVFL